LSGFDVIHDTIVGRTELSGFNSLLVANPSQGSPPYRGGMVDVSQRPLELCWLESCTPGGAIHAEQVEG